MKKEISLSDVLISLKLSKSALAELKNLVCSPEIKTDVDAIKFASKQLAMYALINETIIYTNEAHDMLEKIDKKGMGDVA